MKDFQPARFTKIVMGNWETSQGPRVSMSENKLYNIYAMQFL